MKLKIFQIRKHSDYRFMNYNYASKNGFNLEDYECVWEEDIDSDTSLDDIFTRFNIDRPYGFNGHSLSVSDIVDLDGHKFYCDSTGWVELN